MKMRRRARARKTQNKKSRLFFADWYGEKRETPRPWSQVLVAPVAILATVYAFLITYAVVLGFNDAPESGLRYTAIVVVLVALGVAFVLIIKIFRDNEKILVDAKERESFERRYLMTIINNLTDAILAIDKNGKVLFYNAGALDLFDTNQSLAGALVENLLKLKNGNGTKIKIWDEIKNDERIYSRNDLTMERGEDKVNLEIIVSPIASNGEIPLGFVIMLRNITAEKSLEESKDEFIAVTGHELRTPIAVAEGSVSNLKALMNKGNVDEETLKHSVEMADEQIKMLAKIANDLLTLSRLDRGPRVPKERIDIAKFADEIIVKYKTRAEEKGLTIRAEVGKNIGEVETVKLYLGEILQNFITNAIKYTEKGGIILKIYAGDGFVEFDVIDTGIGISKRDLANVFEKFYRSEDFRTRKTGGTGLGLYIVRRLADIIKAKVVFESELNEGSVFGVQIRRRQK